MTCPVCGTSAVPGARFCFHCGTALEPALAELALAEAEAERRIVTVLFGDLSDFTSWAEDLDPERVGVVTDRVLAALADAVTEFGGTVDKLTGDGIMAVFGAPTAHEDDAERAVRAAAAMQQAVRRLVEAEQGGGRRLGLRVGLNTGEVLAGVQASRAYTVVGDTVNTASRLSDAAGIGAVFAGRETAVATLPVASWRALPPLRLKGKREPVAAYELVGLHGATAARLGVGEEAPTIGRDAELGLLMGRFLDVTDRATPATVLITGEAGVGKTRLASELARFVGEVPAARVLWGRCTPYGEGRDLAPLAEMVRTACGITDGEDLAEARIRLRRAVARLEHPAYAGAVPSGLEERLSGLLGLSETWQPPWDAATPGPPQRGRERAAVVSLFAALAADGPLLLVVDDAHLARPALLEAIAAVAAGLTGRVLLVAAGRPELLEVSGDWWMTLPDPQLLPLVPLEEGAAERLLRAYLSGSQLDPEVRTLVLDRAAGNPFFLAELLHLLVDRGVLRRTPAGWVFEGELPPGLLPAGVHAVLAARIDSLGAASKAVLRDAAVLGARFPVAALGSLGHADGAGLAAALADLEARGMIRPDGEGYYRFGHTLARDAAYAGLPKADRARRHALAAGWAASELPGPSDDVDTVVAAQAERAVTLAAEMSLPSGDRAWSSRGLGFAAAARLGQTALDRDDHRAAEEQFDRALRLGGSAVPRELVIPARLAHAEALAGLRRLGEAEAELAGALAAAEPGLRSGALVVLGDIRRKRGDENGARAAFVSALAAASDAGLDRVTGRAIRQLGLLDYFTGRLPAAEHRFREALELARRVGDQRGAGWALQHLAWSATTRGDYPLAEQALRDAAAVFGGLSDAGGLSWCAGTEAFVRVLQGRLALARRLAGGLLEVAESSGQRWEVAACLTIDALAAAQLGSLSVARREAAEAGARFAAAADTWGQSLALAASGLVAGGLADPAAARSLLGQAVQVADEGGHTVVVALALVFLGLVQLDAGDLDGAAGSVARLEKTLSGLELKPAALVGPWVLSARVLLAGGQVDAALALLRRIADLPAGPDVLFPRRQALAHLAEALHRAGQLDEALAVAREAVDAPAEDVRSRVVALRVLALVLAARGEQGEARAVLDEAWVTATATEQLSERAPIQLAREAVP